MDSVNMGGAHIARAQAWRGAAVRAKQVERLGCGPHDDRVTQAHRGIAVSAHDQFLVGGIHRQAIAGTDVGHMFGNDAADAVPPLGQRGRDVQPLENPVANLMKEGLGCPCCRDVTDLCGRRLLSGRQWRRCGLGRTELGARGWRWRWRWRRRGSGRRHRWGCWLWWCRLGRQMQFRDDRFGTVGSEKIAKFVFHHRQGRDWSGRLRRALIRQGKGIGQAFRKVDPCLSG